MAFRFTIVADGGSDAALVPIVEWVLSHIKHISETGIIVEFTIGRRGVSQHDALTAKIERALQEFPSDLLFIHRDAEGEPHENRHEEIASAIAKLKIPLAVSVVPVRMTEAWLLFDEGALRKAADNPNGKINLSFPAISKLESLPDPKQICNEMMVRASEKSGRRREKFNRDSELAWRRVRLANLIEDFKPLLQLPAFKRFYDATSEACGNLQSASSDK